MPRTRRLQLLITPLAVAAALAFSACGGDDEEETIPLADWIAQADEICQEGDADLQQETADFFGGELPEAPKPEQLNDLAGEVFAPNFQSQLDQIRDLPEPDESADQVDEMLNSLEDGINTLEDDPSAITTEDGPEGFQNASEIAQELGLENCGQ